MGNDYIQKLVLSKFTAFDNAEIKFTPGTNIFIGENGTGKTHILKLIYSVLSTAYMDQKNNTISSEDRLAEKLINNFRPSNSQLGRLVRRQQGLATAKIEICRASKKLTFQFSTKAKNKLTLSSKTYKKWSENIEQPVYIPTKEILTNAPGLISLFEKRELEIEEIYKDLVINSFTPALKGPKKERQNKLLRIIGNAIKGKVVLIGEHFFLKNRQGDLEFSLLSEGISKLALIWLLIQNGTLLKGATLFWDEPETNLNPSLLELVVKILLELQREGVQIFIATHSYVLLKEFDLNLDRTDKILFHSLSKTANGNIDIKTTKNYLEIDPNVIQKTYLGLYEKDLQKTYGAKKE